jgi:hypothetical protein
MYANGSQYGWCPKDWASDWNCTGRRQHSHDCQLGRMQQLKEAHAGLPEAANNQAGQHMHNAYCKHGSH